MNNKVLIHVSLISILHCKERLTMLNGELSDHRAHPKIIPVAPDVVVEDLGEYSPVLQAPIKRLMTRPDAVLHLEVLDRGNDGDVPARRSRRCCRQATSQQEENCFCCCGNPRPSQEDCAVLSRYT